MDAHRTRLRTIARASTLAAALGATLVAIGCAAVPQNRREYLADPTMQLQDDPLEARASRKLWTSREGAAGGDAKPAGGGCGCSN